MNITIKFGLNKQYLSACRITSGQINDTYQIEYDENERFILQRVNGNVFRSPEKIMRNIKLLNSTPSFDGIIPRYLDSGGDNCVFINGSLWRMCPFISNTFVRESFDNEALCKSFGKILGAFHSAAKTADSSLILETLPHFHDTNKIIQDLFALGTPIMHEGILKRAAGYSRELYRTGRRQIVHNDAKCSNVLFYSDKRPAALIDLDTVMEGLPVYDVGDAVRSSCASGTEIDEKRFISFIKGYAEENGSLNAEDCVYAVICVSAELAARYLYDFLSGGSYFRFKSGRMKLERFKTLAALAENTESSAEKLIRDINRIQGVFT